MRLHSEGRGRAYTKLRGVTESALRVLYRGDWPARAWSLFPRACEPVTRRARVSIGEVRAPRTEPIRIAFASDLHLGPTTPDALLDAAFDAIARARPHVLLLGGDYVFLDATREKARRLARLVDGIDAQYKYYVLGNHDLWTHHHFLEEELAQAGAIHLRNRAALPEKLDHIAIVGLDDPWTGAPDAAAAFAGAPRDRFPIVLCHSPDGLPLASQELRARTPREGEAPHALFLCGHTHGGHLSTPFGPLVVPGRIGKLHPSGFHRTEGIELCVSRGVGGIEVPMRSWARPEIVVIDLI